MIKLAINLVIFIIMIKLIIDNDIIKIYNGIIMMIVKDSGRMKNEHYNGHSLDDNEID